MPKLSGYDAVVVGSGPNGLAGAIALARAGCRVIIFEAYDSIGGGTRTAELTLPGFHHDICAAIMPLAAGSPYLSQLPLEQYGLSWIQPDLPVAHPFDDGTAAALHRSVEATADTLDGDAAAYRNLMEPLVADWDKLAEEFLGPFRLPRHPISHLRFDPKALRSAEGLAQSTFAGPRARGLFAGLAGHSIMPLDKATTAAFGLVLGILGHRVGWPIPRGGAGRFGEALACYFSELGGEIVTGFRVTNLADLPPAQVVLFDLTPRQILQIAGDRLPPGYRRRLQGYRYGPGVFKVDWALDGPIPWQADACRRAGTVHVGGTLEEIAIAEQDVWQGKHPARPYVLLAQQSLFDDSRAPAGKHTAWAYCHVPNGSSEDMSEAIAGQIERFAPGFRDLILAEHTYTAAELGQYNLNYVGGDINGGVQDLRQLFARPVARLVPYSTPAKGIYICSSATPPGGGVHGMCGYHAALAALKEIRLN